MDNVTSFRVPPLVSFVASNLECSEPTNLDSFSSKQGLFHAYENGIDHKLGMLPGHPLLLSQAFDQFRFGHAGCVRLRSRL